MDSKFTKRILTVSFVFAAIVIAIKLIPQLISGDGLRTKEIAGDKSLGIKSDKAENIDEPNDWFYLQRTYPAESFDWKAYQQSLQNIQQDVNNRNRLSGTSSTNGFNASWLTEGPGNIGGRINAVIVHPTNQNIIYAGNSSGGIFKTTNGGSTWSSIFDVQSYLSIGCLAFEPGNPNTIYAGTGDPQVTSVTFLGDGIYKSTDAGTTWTHLGPSLAGVVSKIAINPVNKNIIYAATMGIAYQRSPDRGLYKSTDGGATWNNILFVSDSSGIIDLVMDFTDPNILYAASWNGIRSANETLRHGYDAKIFKTTNGGTSWTQLTGGLPIGDYSRIGLTMSGLNHNVLFTSYTDPSSYGLYGIYKTTNGGTSWSSVGTSGLGNPFSSYGWYFSGIKVNPTNDNILFIGGVDLYKSTDGGNSWNLGAPEWYLYQVHADHHDINFYSGSTIYLTNDGGLYKTTDGGANWTDIENIPNNQFYHITYDPINAGKYAGGVQDNGTTSGNASLLNSWDRIYGGDGFGIIYHPTDPNIIWAETQNGGIVVSTDGGINFNDGTTGIGSETRNWDMQYIMSSGDPYTLYTGTTMVYKNTSGEYPAWSPVSPNLIDASFNDDPRFHTISCLTESSVNNNNLYAGTSDGNVWRSMDAGSNWTNVTSTLPDRYVTCLKASHVNAAVAFVTHSGYKANDNIPHVHKTTNNGATWTDISGDLPQIAVDCILTYPGTDNVLFVGTDGGVYGTLNGGLNWTRVGNNMPVVPVFDLQLDPNANKLLAGTHGRSLMSYPMDSIFSSIEGSNVSVSMPVIIYPNPVQDHFTIKLNTNKLTNASVSILSISGELVRSSELELGKETIIPLSDVASGVYLIRLKGKGIDKVQRIVKL